MARLTGRLGTLTFNSELVADLFDWVAEWEVEFAAAPIKGEAFNTGAIGGFTGRVTARRFVNDANKATTNYLALAEQVINQSLSGLTSGVATGAGPGDAVTYVLDVKSGGGSTLATITGDGVVRRGTLNAPRDLSNDTFEIEMTSIPVIT